MKIRNKILHYYSKLLRRYSRLLYYMKLAPDKRIVVLGHMRSGSSLITHILFDHPEILGFGETGNIYSGNDFHFRLIESILTRKKSFFIKKNRNYVLDKILHAGYIKDDDTLKAIIEDKNTYVIFIIREPSGSIPSILNTFKSRGWKDKESYDYYMERLVYLEKCSAFNNSKKFFIDYSDFIINHESILLKLTSFLGLKTVLHPVYKVTEFTGVYGVGDWSNNIFSGRILKEEEKESSFKASTVEKQFIENAYIRYTTVKENLRRVCIA